GRDRVDAVEEELACLCSALPRFGQRQGMGRADAHVVETTVADVAEDVLLAANRRDEQIERAAAGVQPRRFGSLNPARCQSVKWPCHSLCFRAVPYGLPIFRQPTLTDKGGRVKTRAEENLG